MVSQVLTTKAASILLEIKRYQQQQLLRQSQLTKEIITNLGNNLDKGCRTSKLLKFIINSNKEISKDKTITDQWHEIYINERPQIYFK